MAFCSVWIKICKRTCQCKIIHQTTYEISEDKRKHQRKLTGASELTWHWWEMMSMSLMREMTHNRLPVPSVMEHRSNSRVELACLCGKVQHTSKERVLTVSECTDKGLSYRQTGVSILVGFCVCVCVCVCVCARACFIRTRSARLSWKMAPMMSMRSATMMIQFHRFRKTRSSFASKVTLFLSKKPFVF